MNEKTFDCVEMKRKAQEEIYKEIEGLSRQEQVEYFRRADQEFWKDIESRRETLRKNGRPERP